MKRFFYAAATVRCFAGLLFAVGLTLGPATAVAQAPAFLSSWPTTDIPLGMAIDAGGLLYIGAQDAGSGRAHIYTQSGSPIGAIPGGSETYGVGFLHSGELLLANYYGHRVDVFAPGGAPLGSWTLPGSNALYLAVDELDNVYVTSDNSDHVYKVNHTGAALADWSSPHPAGVAYLNGKVYVAGMWNGLISVYAPDGTPSGSFPTGCTWAEQLSVDAAGNLLLSDHGLHQLKCFRPNGTLLWTLGPAVPGYGPGNCGFFSVTPGASGTILVGDYANRRVLIFAEQATSTTTTSWGALKARYR